MRRKIRYYRLIWLRHDLPAGLSVFFVALPLCLGIALASGAPLYAGLLSGIIGGLLVSLISGSQLAVSGPAAGLTTLVAASITSCGDYRIFLPSVIVAGLFQVLIGLVKLGTIANYFPSSVIKGMLAAIGIILITKQIPIALGYEEADFWTKGLSQLFSGANVKSNVAYFNQHLTRETIIITLLSLAVLGMLQLPAAKRLNVIPAPLVVVLAGILINLIFAHAITALPLRQTQLVSIPSNVFQRIALPDFSKMFSVFAIWKNGIVIGLLATLESLLCVEAIDKLDSHNRITPVNRELIAQGLGNMACGLLGAIPITAVVVRGAANANAGARTWLSAFTHGLFLLLSVLFIPFLLNQIPYASLCAILLMTGYNLTRPKLYRKVWQLGRKQFIPFIATVLVILATDLLIGVLTGLILAAYYIILNNFRAEYRITKTLQHITETQVIKLNTNVTFLNKVNLRKTLDRVPPYSILTIDGSECNFIDYDILEIISEYGAKAHDKHIELNLKGIVKVDVSALH